MPADSKTFEIPPDLRLRFLLLTLIAAAFVISLGTVGRLITKSENQEYIERLQSLDAELDSINKIHVALSDLYQNTDRFLLDPTNKDIQKYIKTMGFGGLEYKINKAMRSMEQYGLGNDLKTVRTDFLGLVQHINALIAIRTDPNIQYPAMAYAANKLGDLQAEVNSALERLVVEIETGGFEPKSEEVYPLLLKAQNQWSKSISQLRIYLANRLASFSVDILKQQAQSLDDIFDLLDKHLTRLVDLYENEPESFEGVDTVRHAQEYAREWRKAFDDVERINMSESWREDTYQKETIIIPLMLNLNKKLNEVEWSLNEERDHIVNALAENTTGITYDGLLVLLQAVIVAFYLFLIERVIIKPMVNTQQKT